LGVGISSNNVVEAYPLMQELILTIEANIQSLIVVGDSDIVMSKMVSKNTVVDNILALMLDQAKK
jgi:hypothetical protein